MRLTRIYSDCGLGQTNSDPCRQTPGSIRVNHISRLFFSLDNVTTACVKRDDLAACGTTNAFSRLACWQTAFATTAAKRTAVGGCGARLVHAVRWVHLPAAAASAVSRVGAEGHGSLVPTAAAAAAAARGTNFLVGAWWRSLPADVLSRLGAAPGLFEVGTPGSAREDLGEEPDRVVRGPWTDLVAARVSEARQAATNATSPVETKHANACSGTKARCATWQRQSLLWAEVRRRGVRRRGMKGERGGVWWV
jgi:hypothetical protein